MHCFNVFNIKQFLPGNRALRKKNCCCLQFTGPSKHHATCIQTGTSRIGSSKMKVRHVMKSAIYRNFPSQLLLCHCAFQNLNLVKPLKNKKWCTTLTRHVLMYFNILNKISSRFFFNIGSNC